MTPDRRRVVLWLVAAGLATALCPAAAGATEHWVGSWMAAPSDGLAAALTDQTVRVTAVPHLTGKRLRVRLSNRYGEAPLAFARVTIARRGRRGGIVSSTLRTVTFRGRTAVRIPTGGQARSDPLSARLRAGRAMVISVAVRGSVSAPTEHHNTREVNYITQANSGDHTRDVSGAAFRRVGAAGSGGGFFVAGLDVRAPRRTSAIVAFGDSLTDGFQGSFLPAAEDLRSVGREQRYPDLLQRRLDRGRRPVSVLNAGINGDRVLRTADSAAVSALPRLEADAIRQPGVRCVIFLDGINDIGTTAGLTPKRLIDGYKRIIRRVHAARLRILLGTIPPAGGTILPGFGQTADRVRLPVNRWIRRQELADAVVDFDRAVRDPVHPERLRTTYDGGDHLHLSPLGYRAMARAVPLRALP